MSRKMTLSLAAAAIAVATVASQSADARGFGGGGFGHFGGSGFSRVVGGGYGGRSATFTGRGGRLASLTGRGNSTLVPIIPGPPPGRHTPIVPIVPIHPIFPPIAFHDHHHRWVFRDGGWVVIDEAVDESAPVIDAAPSPCTCLTKTYTPSGLVVFADVCTKESASASVDTSADATQVPTTPVAATAVPMSVVPTTPDYAGRTYEDYLAANPQLAQPQASVPQALAAPQKN
jgi:hypothetical protein